MIEFKMGQLVYVNPGNAKGEIVLLLQDNELVFVDYDEPLMTGYMFVESQFLYKIKKHNSSFYHKLEY